MSVSGTERIRVVQLVATGTTGGAQEHVATLLEGLDRSRFDVRVISMGDGEAVHRWRSLGIEVDVVVDADDATCRDRVAARLVLWRTQIVHAHMYRAEIVGAAAVLRAEQSGAPRCWLIDHIHSSRRRSAVDREHASRSGATADRVVAVSHAIEAKLASERPNGPAVELIYNGVNLDRFGSVRKEPSVRAELGIPGDAPLIGCIARLEPEKGHRTLIRAWVSVRHEVPNARLLLVGDGSLRSELEAMADDQPGSRGSVTFAGTRLDVPALTATLDLAVLPSHREAQGLAIVEAMALGRPVVATRVGGIPEMITHEESGLLVQPSDEAALAAAIVRLLRDEGLAIRLGAQGRLVARERFSAKRMVEQIAVLYEEGAQAWAALRRGGRARHEGGRIGSGSLC